MALQKRVNMLKELHKDLARTYHLHGLRFEQIWCSLDQTRRTEVFREAHAVCEPVLKDVEYQPIGNPYRIDPELKLGDIGNLDSAEVLDMLKHRATTSIHHQYCEGVRGGPGDHAFIINTMPVNNSPLSERFKNYFTLFLDEDQYGDTMKVTDPAQFDRIMADLSVVVDAGFY
jgi:hypothetical protein